MDAIRRCIQCILPDTTPGIRFDKIGLCNFYRSYNAPFSVWEAVNQKIEDEFRKILHAARGLKRPQDCLHPLIEKIQTDSVVIP